MSTYLGALDQGTSSTRFVVFDASLRQVAVAQREHAQICPQPGWVEHDANEIWRNCQVVIEDALRSSGLAALDVGAIGVTNQRETVVMWDRGSGEPLSHAIVWLDTRVANDLPTYARDPGAEFIRSRTGLPLSTYFSALKIRWLLDHSPGTRERAEQGEVLCGTMDSFLVWNLTGGPRGGQHVTDVTNASRTQLMALETLDWDPSLLAAFDIPRAMLPAIRASSHAYGHATIAPLADVPISAILGDQQAALVGQACFEPGETKNTYGTGCFMLMNTGESPVFSTSGLLTTVAYQLGDQPAQYALEGSVAVAGALVQWARDNLGLVAESRDIEKLAASVDDNGGVYFVPAFSGLYAPHWNARARGTIVGLTHASTRGHLARAVIEATAFQTADVLDAMERDAGVHLHELRVDGGMTVNDSLMQFQADLVNRPVSRAATHESTALGAACAAGLAVGIFRDVADIRARWAEDGRWVPRMTEGDRAHLRGCWHRAVSRSIDWMPEDAKPSLV